MEAQKAYVTDIAKLFPRQGEWTEDDYFALPETHYVVELAHGVLTVSPAPDDEHQSVSIRLSTALQNHVTASSLGLVRYAPYDVRLAPGIIRQPDILFLREEHRGRVRGKRLHGPPDWVAEIISPGSRETDTVVKPTEYAQAGVPEFWLLDPKKKAITVYTLSGDTYTVVETYTSGQTARAMTIAGFQIAVDTLFSVGS